MKTIALFALCVAGLLAQTPPLHPAWSSDQVHIIRLRFSQPDFWEQMTQNYARVNSNGESTYVEASLEWGSYTFASVGVRFKGNSSYLNSRTRKKPFRIKLNEFVKGQKIQGIASFNLNNGFNDPSLIRESLYYELAKALGLKAPRSGFAALYVNDEYYGLYGLGEVINGDFLKNYFGDKEDTGNLYKGNIGASFADLGDDKERYKSVWEKQSNEEADDWADLIELCRLIDKTPAAELKAKLEPVMDIDSVLTALALDNATANLDSYVGLGQNFNIYRRPSDKRWVWLVWDPSLSFAALTTGVPASSITELPIEFTQASGLPGGGNPPPGQPPPGVPGGGFGGGATRPLATKLWEIPEYKERYRQIYKDLVTRLLNKDAIIARATVLRAMIRPFVQQDGNLLNTYAQFEQALTAPIPEAPQFGPGGPGGQGGGAPMPIGLKTFLDGRTTWLTSQFASQSFATPVVTASINALNATGSVSQAVDLRYTGVATPATWSLIASTNNGGNWLSANITGGAFPGRFEVNVNAKDLPSGYYGGSLAIHLGGTRELVIPVNLTNGAVTPPTLTSVLNGASYSTGAISAGQIATVFGSNLGTPGLKIAFDGQPGQLIYATPNQAGVIVPTTLAGKTQTTAQASYGPQASATLSKTVAKATPGIFTTNSSGSGQGAIVNQNGTVNGPTAPAAKGSIVAIYLTGGGVDLTAADTTVRIGGQSATVVYAGVAPGSIQGLQQINVTIPAGAGSGAQPLAVTIAGADSQANVTVFVQ